MNMKPDEALQHFDAAASAVAAKTMYAGSVTVGLGWLTSNEFAVLMGILIGVAGFVVNWYYKAKEDRRREREVEARIRRNMMQEVDLDMEETP